MEALSLLNFQIPTYCEYYKNLLVEEIHFLPNPIKLHYGKCAVIGRLILDQRKYYIENVKLNFLDDKCRLQTGDIRVLLLPSTETEAMPIGCLVEIHGETVAWLADEEFARNKVQDDIPVPTTSKDLILHIRDMQHQLEQAKSLPLRQPTGMNDKSMNSSVKMALRKELSEMEKNYVPAIRVVTCKCIDQAEELIHCNLELRLIRQMQQQQINGRRYGQM